MTAATPQPFCRFHARGSRGGINACGAMLILCGLLAAESTAPWEKPRQLSDFQFLLKRSPFSLPTAEESSPLSERYALTGIVTIGGVEQVFVFDRTDQSRELLTRKPNSKNMALVSLVREGAASVPTKATIRVGNETGTIGYLEASQQPQVQQQPPQQQQIAQQQGAPRPGVQLPPVPKLPQQGAQGVQGATPPARRLIRRPVVMPQQQAAPQQQTPPQQQPQGQ
jgi:hypothetical protein